MKKVIAFIVLAISVFSGTSYAQNAKVEIDFMSLNTELETLDFDTTAIQFKLINPVNPSVDIEAVVAIGLSDDGYLVDFGFGDTLELSGELSNMIGVFLKGHSSTGGNSEIYGRIGIAKVEYEFSVVETTGGFVTFSGSESESDTGIAFGFGASFGISQESAITVEYNQLPDVDLGGLDLETTSLSVGYQMSF